MDRKSYWATVERDHEIQNPSTPEKFGFLIEHLAIDDGCRILDVGCGKAWLLRVIAGAKAVKALGLEVNPVFAAQARQALAREDLKGSVDILEGPALSYEGTGEAFDVSLCIGASFAIGSFEDAVDWLHRRTVPGGRLAIGEPYARRLPFPPSHRGEYGCFERSLPETAEVLAKRNLELIGVIAASTDDWDHYESLHWRAARAWAQSNPTHPDRDALIEQSKRHRQNYLGFEREYLGWAIFICGTEAPQTSRST
jgi:SAM-dependent methyltransferase